MIALILARILVRQGNEFAPLLVISVCCMIFAAAITYFRPVLNFMDRLQSAGQLDAEVMKTLLRITGICLLSEIASLICNDMGNSALSKGQQILSTVAILWMSIPLFEELLELLEMVLGDI